MKTNKNIETNIEGLPKLLTPNDIREYFKTFNDGKSIGNNKLYCMIRSKTFPSFKIGKNYYIIEDKFIEWLNQQTKKINYI